MMTEKCLSQLPHLYQLQLDNKIRAVDYRFACFMHEQSGSMDDELTFVYALVSYELGKGNVCIDLENNHIPYEISENEPPLFDGIKSYTKKLLATRVVGRSGELRPLILDGSLLYLSRYWHYEDQVAQAIKKRIGQTSISNAKNIKSALDRLFDSGGLNIDWQKIAAAMAINSQFCVITGGPGTGKTTTVTRILALLMMLSMSEKKKPPLIKLVAPTGKAAARLSESIKGAKQRLDCSDEVLNGIPEIASTIHRLLGVVPNSPNYRHNSSNPLMIDLLVVDEASMVDLPLMAKLLQSLPDFTRVIFLGDKDQLSSVEAGSVLGDVCGGGESTYFSKSLAAQLDELCGCVLDEYIGKSDSLMADSIVTLQHSHRFGNDSGIKQLAEAVNIGDVDKTVGLLADDHQGIDYFPHAEESYQHLINTAVKAYQKYFELVKQNRSPGEIFDAFNQFRVLCALRSGDFGVELMNLRIEQALIRKGLIQSDMQWYAGRPIMVTANDYGIGLYNGDVGITIRDESDDQLRVLFIMPDGAVRKLSPGRLPPHETVYAMTVHKSQGSEYNQIALILPAQFTLLLSRELLYTAITRARERFLLFASESVISAAVSSPTHRVSGLKKRLWG